MISFKHIILVLIISCILISNVVWANEYDDNFNASYVSTEEHDFNNCLSINNSFKSINSYLDNLNNSNNIIYLENGVYSGINNSNIDIDNLNITIVGLSSQLTFIDGEGFNRLFNINSNSNVVLINLSIINGFNNSLGGAIYNEGNLTLINCSFSKNSVFGENYVYGGAIYNKGQLNILNSLFDNNFAGKFDSNIKTLFAAGGAIYNKGNLFINNSCFSCNDLNNDLYSMDIKSYQDGGAIYSESAVFIYNSIFKNNSLDAYKLMSLSSSDISFHSRGGALYLECDNSCFNNCSFINNNADIGGAIFINGNNCSFDLCNFYNNSAYSGGALASADFDLKYSPDFEKTNNIYSNILFNHCKFVGNYLDAPYNDNVYFTLYCGSVFYLKMDNISISGCSFNNNFIKESKIYGYAIGLGAIYSLGSNTTFINSSFVNNSAYDGGAIYDRGANTKIINCYFKENRATKNEGGAIFHFQGNNLSVINSQFIKNSATSGAAIYSVSRYDAGVNYDNNYGHYDNCSFINNHASNYGGAIFDNGDISTFKSSMFFNNSAGFGGAIYHQGFGSKFIDLIFVNNSALNHDYSNGGAIYNYGSYCEVINCLFNNSVADNSGGAIYNSGNDYYCINSTFNNNGAFNGGASFLTGVGGRVENNSFFNNSAIYGGSIYNDVTNLIVYSNIFNYSIANVSGGVIYNNGESFVSYNNLMFNCIAAISGYGFGNYIYTTSSISYALISFLNNGTLNIYNQNNGILFVNVTDNMGNQITGGNITFTLINESSGHMEDIGCSDVYEGVAYLIYGKDLSYGNYSLSGRYSFAVAPVLTKKGNLMSAITTNLFVNINENIDEIYLGDSLNFNIVLIDGNDNYVDNAEIKIYQEGKFIGSVFTNENGIAVFNLSNLYLVGIYDLQFVYGGNLNYYKSINEFSFTVNFNNDVNIINTSLVPSYPLFISNVGSSVVFDFFIYGEDKPLDCLSLSSFFSVYENDILIDTDVPLDSEGRYYGSDLLYQINKGAKVYLTSRSGSFLMDIQKDIPGIYNYMIVFKGGYVFVRYLDDNSLISYQGYYAPTNVSFLLIVNDENANISTSMVINYSSSVSEAELANFNVYLKDKLENPISNEYIDVYDYGVYLTTVKTNSAGFVNFTYGDYFDLGDHIIEFVFAGNDDYLACVEVISLYVHENLNKKGTVFINNSELNFVGQGNNFSAILRDIEGNPLINKTIKINVLSGNFSLKNISAITNENGIFSIPLNISAGNLKYSCYYGGDKFNSDVTRVFDININKTNTFMFGAGSLEVMGDDNYLTLILVDENYVPFVNESIKILVLSKELNTTYYAFTNESGVAKFKINLSPDNYLILSTFEENKWYFSSSVLTNVVVYGGYSKLNVNKTIIIKESGFYTILLTDGNGIPLSQKQIMISVNGVNYKRTTDDQGKTSLKINLPYGKYLISTSYKGDIEYKGSNCISELFVVDNDYKYPSVLSTENSIVFREEGIYNVTLTDMFGIPLSNKELVIFIDGNEYKTFTNDMGIAFLNIKLSKGVYIISTSFNGDSEYQNSSIKSTINIVNKNAAFTTLTSPVYLLLRGKNNYFTVNLKDKSENPLKNQIVFIEVNGVSYKKTTDDKGDAYLKINLNQGSYVVNCVFNGFDDYFASKSTTKLVVLNEGRIAKFIPISSFNFIGKGYCEVKLVNGTGHSLSNKPIDVMVNGVIYNRVTNDEGIVKLNINLIPGSYQIKFIFKGDDVYNQVMSSYNISINSTIQGLDLVKYFKNDSHFHGKLIGIDGKPIGNQKVSMNINGVIYVRNTDDNGIFKLNINLGPGNYILTVSDPNIAHIMKSFNITVLSTIVVGNLNKVFGEKEQYKVNIINNQGKSAVNHNISININGIIYNRTTDDEGNAYLDINLICGNYVATVCDLYNGLLQSSNVNILNSKPIMKSNGLVFNDNKRYFEIKLTDDKNIPLTGEKVTIKVNGVSYNRTVSDDGFVRLNINLQKGSYNIQYNYGDLKENQTIKL